MITRRDFLAATAAGLASRGLRAQARPRTNLLFLITDQHHAGWLGCAGHPLVKTPHLDRLAAGGVRCTNAFVPVPYCSPTRYALMTGRYPSGAGLGRNIDKADDPLRLRDPAQTYAGILANQGYHCHQVGKWHLGDPRELACYPDDDAGLVARLANGRRRAAGAEARDAGQRAGEQELVGDVWLRDAVADAHARWLKEDRRPAQDIAVIGRSRLKPRFHNETAITDHCVDLLRARRDEPFTLTWSVSPPHAPWIAPSLYYDQYDPAAFKLPPSWDQPPAAWAGSASARLARIFGEAGCREYLRCYAAQVTWMDALLGRLLDTLDELELAERTLVVFTSDHGNLLGQHRMMDKSVGTFYDDLVRVPLLLRLPGTLEAGRVCTDTFSSVDLAPTLLGLLGAPGLTAAQGRDARGVLAGREPGRDTVFAEREDPRKPAAARMVRTREWKLNLFGGGRGELFDLVHDPDETRDLFADPAHAAVVADLRARLRQHATAVGDPAAVARA